MNNNHQTNSPNNKIKNKTNETVLPLYISKTITTMNLYASTSNTGRSTRSNKRLLYNSSNALSELSSPNTDTNIKQKNNKKKIFAFSTGSNCLPKTIHLTRLLLKIYLSTLINLILKMKKREMKI
jgi:hypothetical protein